MPQMIRVHTLRHSHEPAPAVVVATTADEKDEDETTIMPPMRIRND
eukprot:CAMPEP_0172510896 /NCGR_PEP_ID=MMETSP1066-20121228/232253_1 /TAXON_ID=671091 /ORGANISM="Coscinodiscus wailesii, Strain CCMP2513" /LENGTH=45 /DNA_ID= /DNA_START= /DNA_END= /DNA_ORIENTATION=